MDCFSSFSNPGLWNVCLPEDQRHMEYGGSLSVSGGLSYDLESEFHFIIVLGLIEEPNCGSMFGVESPHELSPSARNVSNKWIDF